VKFWTSATYLTQTFTVQQDGESNK